MVQVFGNAHQSDSPRSRRTIWLSMLSITSSCYVAIALFLTASDTHVTAFATAHIKHKKNNDCRSWNKIRHQNTLFLDPVDEGINAVTKSDVVLRNENESSKRSMLAFAIPALGIYLSSPLLSNIDNAFVGKTAGTLGLAALSPGTICSDQLLYFFSFLSRATTGIVSRAYSKPSEDVELSPSLKNQGNTKAAREAGSAPFTVSLVCGLFLTGFYAVFTPQLLSILNISPELRNDASAYIYWRGSVAWAALAQSVCLSMLMSIRDPLTPLKIVGLAAVLNVVADYLLCVWPFRTGCAGAAAATAFATLVSCGFMLKALWDKNILPRICIPTKAEFRSLLDYTGPLLAITITRMAGFVAMQKTATRLGTETLAGYQVCVNLLMFFLLFGEPLSQVSQTKLPGFLDQQDGVSIRACLKSISILAALTSVGIAALASSTAQFGAAAFTSDAVVQTIARTASPSLFIAVSSSILAVAVDGALMASRDYAFMLILGLGTYVGQLLLLQRCATVSDILLVFALRLGTYAFFASGRIILGFGEVGRCLKAKRLVQA